MRKFILGLTVAAATLAAGGAMAQSYGGYRGDYGYDRRDSYNDHRGGSYGYRYARYRDSDRDGISDRREWGLDLDRDGRPDQWDRYDNRRDRHWRYRHQGNRGHHYGWAADGRYYR